MTLARTIAITLTASVAFGMVAASCTPRTPKTAPSVLEGPTTPTTIKPLVVRVDETEAGSTDGAVAEEAVVVDFALPRGCEKIYDPKDACKTLRALIDTPGRMNNRACLSRLSAIIHGYAFGCRWIDFSSYRDGYGADCYRHLYTGAGIVCTLYHSDPQDPDDGSTPFEWTEKTVRACLDGWTSEKTAKTRLFADIGFSISRRTESDGGISVARVQACRHTSEPRTVDEHARPYVHIEIFTESPDAGRR